MWQDTLKTKFADEEVEVVRAIESPATPDEAVITFPDGSKLKLEVAANISDKIHGEGEAVKIAETQSAMNWYGDIIKKLYADATEKHLDVDF